MDPGVHFASGFWSLKIFYKILFYEHYLIDIFINKTTKNSPKTK
jgi:hypothetical protein